MLRSRTQLLIGLLVTVGVPLAMCTTAVLWNAQSALRAQALRENESSGFLAAHAVEGHFKGLMNYVEHGGRSAALRDALAHGDDEAGRVELAQFLRDNPEFDRAFVTDAEGVELFDWPTDPDVVGKSFAFRDWYKGVSQKNKTYVSEVYRRAAFDHPWIVAVVTPIRTDSGATAGFLVAQHLFVTLTKQLSAIQPGRDGKIMLIDHHVHQVAARADQETGELGAHPAVPRLKAGITGAFQDIDPATGEEALFNVANVPAIGWNVLTQQPLDVVLAPAYSLQRWIVLASGVCLALVVLMGFAWLEAFRRQHLALLGLQRQKDLLVGMIVHDLRNPLAVATLSLEEARHALPRDAAPVRENLEDAYKASQRTLELVNVILDVMRMEDGALRLDRGEDDLSQLVQQKVEEFRALARAGSIEIEAQIPAEPPLLNVDGRLLRRVVDNLIVNAIKHTPRGGRVQVKLESEGGSDRAALSVVDNGEGMPPEMLPRLFQKYGRVEGQKLGRSYDSGLGLLFCRMAVELHGGTIEAMSKLGEGTTIRIELPRAV